MGEEKEKKSQQQLIEEIHHLTKKLYRAHLTSLGIKIIFLVIPVIVGAIYAPRFLNDLNAIIQQIT